MKKTAKKPATKIVLNKEILLNVGDLDHVAGGGGGGCNVSRNSGCACSFNGPPVEQ